MTEASRLIDARIAELGDWRGATLARIRALIHRADPEVVETWKWRGVPVWEHEGIICTGETYRTHVKLTFAKGAALDDPSGLFNASLAYAKVTEPAAGLYYISDAVANRRFADFAASVEFSEEGAKAPEADALRSAWTALETEALKVFEADPVGRTAIGPSARLKETRELIDRGSLAGATLLLLESRLEEGRFALRHRLDLAGVDVDADDLVADRCHGGGVHRAEVAAADHRQTHDSCSLGVVGWTGIAGGWPVQEYLLLPAPSANTDLGGDRSWLRPTYNP